MLKRPLSSFVVGGVLALIFAVGIAAVLGALSVRLNYRHVIVDVFNVDDIARVEVNCQVALVVDAEDGAGRVDLGYLKESAEITFSVYNVGGDAAWGFRGTSNDDLFFGTRSGAAGGVGYPAEERAVVMVKSFLATGSPQGVAGCRSPGLVSPALRSKYRNLTANQGRAETEVPPQEWSKARPGLALVSSAGEAAPWVLGLIGFIAALATRSIRNRLWGRWQFGGVLGVISLLFGVWLAFSWEGLLVLGELLGVLLLLGAAGVHLGTGLRELWRQDLAKGALPPKSP